MRPLHSLTALAMTLLISGLFASLPAMAQSLDDFKNASEASACGLIPYPSLRKDCVDAESEKEKACSSGKKFSCGSDLERKEKAVIADRIRNGEECLARREAVASIFERARDTLRSERQDREQYARRSVERIEGGRPNHQKAIEDAKAAIFNCKELAR